MVPITMNIRPALYTFIAVFATIFLIGLFTIPFGLSYAERIYLQQQAEFNERLASLMARFVERRLQGGQSHEEIVREFQYAVEGTHSDAGYVCLIDQGDVRYLSHPDLDVMGMLVKPMALFNPQFSGTGGTRWQDHLRRGESNSGLLFPGNDMPAEIVHFIALPDINWTVSSHENTSRVQAEVQALRTLLTVIFILFGLGIAIPASLAARRVNKYFEDQLQEKHELTQRLLESENERKSQELKGARMQQLSMLPTAPPELDNLDMAFYMNPAMEVGGDYYDYRIGNDGELTVVIGDATGHGLEASTLVTAMKTLFTNLADQRDLTSILQRSTQSIKRMGISKLYMACALIRIKGECLEMIGAGMPPAIIYRCSNRSVESIPLKGMPLGSMDRFPYKKITLTLYKGDVLFLMSDGFPEQFDTAREMIGYDRAVQVMEEIGSTEPEQIIERFKLELDAWKEQASQSDDVTFIAIRSKKDPV